MDPRLREDDVEKRRDDVVGDEAAHNQVSETSLLRPSMVYFLFAL